MSTSHWWCSLEWKGQCTRYTALTHCPLCLSAVKAFSNFSKHILCECYRTLHPSPIWLYELQVAHTELVENESMIHHTVKATVPHTVKSNPDVFGSVEEADAGWSFVKLQHLGSSLQAVPLRMLSSLLELCSSGTMASGCGLHVAGGLLSACGWLLLCHLRQQYYLWDLQLFMSSQSHVLDLQVVTGLHMAGVLHRDVKPGDMLIINGDLCLDEFDVSCSAETSEAALQSGVRIAYFGLLSGK